MNHHTALPPNASDHLCVWPPRGHMRHVRPVVGAPSECPGGLCAAIGTVLSDRLGLQISVHSIAQEGTTDVAIILHHASTRKVGLVTLTS